MPNPILTDGSLDFSGGVNSYLVPTVASPQNPNGLKRNQLAWLNNATVRGGGITQRPTWQKLGKFPTGATGIYQGAFMYEPDEGYPYVIAAIGGHIWRLDPDDPSNGVDLSVIWRTEILVTGAVNDQVVAILTHNDAIGAGTIIPGGQTNELGAFKQFIAPAIGLNVRVALEAVYTGAIGVATVIAGSNYTIAGFDGYALVNSPQEELSLPSDRERFYFCQAEKFLVIQAGDLTTLPLIWDGDSLRRSLGFSGGFHPTKPDNYGTCHGYLPNTWAVPVVLGFINVNLPAPYVGNVGDYLSAVYGQKYNGPNPDSPIGSTILTAYSVEVYRFVVTAIGPGNQITMQAVSILGGGGGTVYNYWNLGLNRLYFVSQYPSEGGTQSDQDPEIPPATAMDYYMGRLWYAEERQYAAGDIVGAASGSLAYDFRDSVLKVSENPLCLGGDGFRVPTNSGNIRAIKHGANLNTALGQGQLYVFTRESVYALTVPVTRNDWIAADTNNQPLQTVVQITNGAVCDRAIAQQNGDLFYLSFEPAIRSLFVAIRYFEQWGNVPISVNENRLLAFNDRSLMQFSSAVSFDNRMLALALPEQTPVGVAHRAIVPLNFDNISTLESKLPPVWEGMYEGVPMLEILAADYGGRPRCFAPVWNGTDLDIELWELTTADRFENGDNRVLWYIEFPAFTWGDEFMFKRLIGAELWLDRLFGTVLFRMEYRPDGDPCWYIWHEWELCTARNSCEDAENPHCVYPREYCESFRQTVKLPQPPRSCQRASGRPTDLCYQMQTKLTIKGFCRIRGLLLKAVKVEEQTYGPEMLCK